MKNVNELKQKRAELIAEAKAFGDLATKENRELLADEKARIDAITDTEIVNLDKDIERANKLEALKIANLSQSGIGQGHHVPESGQWKIPAQARRTSRLKAYKGQDAERKAYAAGQWFLGMIGSEKAKQWAQDHGYGYQNAMTEGFDSKGGFVVPEEVSMAIIDLRNDYGIARRECRVVAMGSDTGTYPRRTGGMTVYAVGEAGTIAASDKTFDQVRLTAKKWGAIGRYSSELAEDAAISIGDDLTSEMAYAFANKEDECVFNADGTSTYHGMTGIKNALLAGSEAEAATGNTSFDTLDVADFLKMTAIAASYTWKESGAKWYIHRAGYSQSMERLQMAAGGNTSANLAAGGVRTFLGYEVVFVEVMNSTLTAQTSTEGLCYFGNLAMGTMFGDRRGMALAMSNDVYFTTDEIAVRGTERFDFNCHDVGTASVGGCIIGLKTPGS